MKRTLITGSNGDLGSHIVSVLSNTYDCCCYDPRNDPKYKFLRKITTKSLDAVIIAHGKLDGNTNDIFHANLNVVKEMLRVLFHKLKKDGIIILISSRKSKCPTIKLIDYSTSKAALDALSKAYYEAYPQLRITTINPGWIQSKWSRKNSIKQTIRLKELSTLIQVIIESKSMRIPEICMEPIGEKQLSWI